MGSLWRPSPSAMKELRKGTPSTVPRTFTSPRVPKNRAESGHTTYVQPPLLGLFSSDAVNSTSSVLIRVSVPCFIPDSRSRSVRLDMQPPQPGRYAGHTHG